MCAFVVLPATLEDLPEVVNLQFDACLTDPGFLSIYKTKSDVSVVHLTTQYERLMTDDSDAHIMIAKDSTRHDIVAYAVWHFLPARDPESDEKEALADIDNSAFPADANIELGKILVKNSIRKRIEVASQSFGMGKPYAYLAAVGTDPKYQKRGAASQLLQWGIHRADERRLPTYVESTSAALSLYQQFGLQEYDRLPLDLHCGTDNIQPVNFCMIKFPGTS